jgi:glycerol-1-phosphate dehydrogenase [NAD(P)+]
VGPFAIREVGDDAVRLGVVRAVVVWSAGLPGELCAWVRVVLRQAGVEVTGEFEAQAGSIAEGDRAAHLASKAGGVIAVGGGRALDVGKYAAAMATRDEGNGVPVVTVPTSLSHDGFASPSTSLVDRDGRRRSIACKGPAGVIVDTGVCAGAPAVLFAAGMGDVVAKVTALSDWWLWEHSGEGKVDGIAATVAESAVALVEHHCQGDEEGYERLARALLLGGVAMAMAGSSRPCSGSEHLVSHALDRLRAPAGSHGVQVGIAAYVMSKLQGGRQTQRISDIFHRSGFWKAAASEGITLAAFREALAMAPSMKPGYLTVLSRPGAIEEAGNIAAELDVWAV